MRHRLGILAWLGLMASLTLANAAPTAQEFVEKTAGACMFGVESATLALHKTNSPEIKSFAHRLANDHATTGSSLRQITARRSDIVLPERPDAKHLDLLRDLAAQPDDAFDRAYVQTLRAAQRETLSLVADYAQSGGDPELKTFAAKVLPILRDLDREAGALPSP